MKAMLSTLWMFYLFNVIFRDIHEFIEPGFIEQVMTGTIDGFQITEPLLLFGGFRGRIADLDGAIFPALTLRPQPLGQHHRRCDYPRV
jgi:hypothetical protein